MTKSKGRHGPQSDLRFQLHQRQPRADKLDARQRAICRIDPAYSEALSRRVSDPARFSAFLAGETYYINLGKPCGKCGGCKRRVRDRSCYRCHLQRSGENFERMKAGIAPQVQRSLDGHLDLLERQKRERSGEFIERQFGSITVKRFPTGRLEVRFDDGHVEPDLNKTTRVHVSRLMEILPEMKEALIWAGWL